MTVVGLCPCLIQSAYISCGNKDDTEDDDERKIIGGLWGDVVSNWLQLP